MNSHLYYYKLHDRLLISRQRYPFDEVSENYAYNFAGKVFALNNLNPKISRRSYCVTSLENLFIKEENLRLLKNIKRSSFSIPSWITEHINNRNITAINTAYPNWQEVLNKDFSIVNEKSKNTKWTISVVGLGDVGGTLITGLRLLGGDCIYKIKIYDKNENKIKRWEYECNQIISSTIEDTYPDIVSVDELDIFDCDMFVFCVSVGVPEIGKETSDVRLAQFEGNSKIIAHYAKLARKNNFKGIFAVVSDPVDLLCKTVFNESNKIMDGSLDFNGLSPEQIRGYGLGVMHARACYYARQNEKHIHYLTEGRAFGPHGEGLIIANSITNYNEQITNYLTDKTRKANLEIRSFGFKPYIAPALSSGALSLIATIKGQWHYCTTFLGGSFMGCKNRLISSGIELETYDNMPNELFLKLLNTYNKYL